MPKQRVSAAMGIGIESGMNPELLRYATPPATISVRNAGLQDRLIAQWRSLFPLVHVDKNFPVLQKRMYRSQQRNEIVTETVWDETQSAWTWWIPVVLPLEEEFYVELNAEGERFALRGWEIKARVDNVYTKALLKDRFICGEINHPIRSPALTAYCHAWVQVRQ